MPHQIAAVQAALACLPTSGGFYFAHDPGCGKTLTTLVTAKLLGVTRIVVLCPLVACRVWEAEANNWWSGLTTQVMRGDGWTDGSGNMLITNYDQLTSDSRRVRKLIAFLSAPGHTGDSGPGTLLVLDESQKCKGPATATSRAVLKLAKAATYRLLLSGTPAHTPLDWWAQYRLVAPQDPMWSQRFGDYKRNIAHLHPVGNWPTKFIDAYVEQARQAMAPYTHVADASEMHVPEPIITPIRIPLEPAARKLYDKLERDLIATPEPADWTVSAETVLVKALRLQQITSGFVRDDDGTIREVSRAKWRAFVELREERWGRNIVAACRFRRDLDELQAAPFSRPWFIHGDVDERTRKQVEEAFQHGPAQPEGKCLLLQYQAGGVALTLTNADALILYSMGPSAIDYRQMLGRVWRIGQTKAVQVLPLLCEHTVDEDIFEGVQRKLDTVDMARLVYQRATERQEHNGR